MNYRPLPFRRVPAPKRWTTSTRSSPAQGAAGSQHPLPFSRSEEARRPGSGYEASFRAVYAQVATASRELVRSRLDAGPLLEELLRHPAGRRAVLIENSARYASWGLAEELLTRADELQQEAPAEMIPLADAALRISQKLIGTHSVAMVQDLAARCWLRLARAHYRTGDAEEAEAALLWTEALLARGSGDPLERAQLLELKASIFRDRGQEREALLLLGILIEQMSRLDDPSLIAHSLRHRAALLEGSGRPGPSIDDLRRAVGLLEASGDTQLHLAFRQQLLLQLFEGDRCREAWGELPALRRLALASGAPRDLLRVRWLDGLLAHRLGVGSRAESSLRAALRGFLMHGTEIETVYCGLDLLDHYLSRKGSSQCRRRAHRLLRAATRHRGSLARAGRAWMRACELLASEGLSPAGIDAARRAVCHEMHGDSRRAFGESDSRLRRCSPLARRRG